MRIVLLSDTHMRHHEIDVPDGDILIHAGDFTGQGYQYEIEDFGEWFNKLPHKHKLYIPGNHELGFEDNFSYYENMLKPATCIHHKQVEINGLKFWGSAWTPYFFGWAFNGQRGEELKRIWSLIPDDVDFLVTHGPPYGTLDLIKTNTGFMENVGCEMLEERIKELKQLKYHVFGHLHQTRGQIQKDGINYINATNLNNRYQYVHQPYIIEVNK